jgi:Tfp pilus assembly protein PilN
MTLKGVDLSSTEKKRFTVDPVLIFLIIVVLLSVGGFWWYGDTFNKKISDREEKIEQVSNQIKEIQNKIPDIDRIEGEIKKLEAEIKWIEGLTKDPFKYCFILREFTSLLPDNVSINNIDIDPSATIIKFSGNAASVPGVPGLTTVAFYIQELQNSKYFGSVKISEVSQGTVEGSKEGEPVDGYAFNMEVGINAAEALNAVSGGAVQ